MTQIKTVDKATEYKLASAIEKAASIALSGDRDRNQVLTQQLKQAGIHPKFAKVAAQAFNKRCTIQFLNRTKAEQRGTDFPLANAQTVADLMQGKHISQPTVQKTASFRIFPAGKPMPKVASASTFVPAGNKTWEQIHSTQDVLARVDYALQKQAAYAQNKCRQHANDKRILQDKLDKLAEVLRKDAHQNNLLCNLYDIRKIRTVLGTRAQSLELQKTASYAVSQGTLAQRLLEESLGLAHKIVQDQTDLVKFASQAGKFSTCASGFFSYIHGLQLQGKLDKTASMPGALLSTLGGAVGGTIGAGSSIANTASDTVGDMLVQIQQADHAKDIGTSPTKIMDAEFLNQDRYRDRMMALSDMLADRNMANYSAGELVNGATRLMDTDLTLQRADRRELLRAGLAQLLAQNNRQSTADIAALGATLKSLSAAQGAGARQALTNAKALTSKQDKRMTFGPIRLFDNIKGTDFSQVGSDLQKTWAAHSKSIKDQADAQAKKDVEQLQQRVKATKEQAAAAKAQQDEKDKKLQATYKIVLNALNKNQKPRRGNLQGPRPGIDKATLMASPIWAQLTPQMQQNIDILYK